MDDREQATTMQDDRPRRASREPTLPARARGEPIKQHEGQFELLQAKLELREREIKVLSQQAEELIDLRERLEDLEDRVAALEPTRKRKQPREPWKIRLAKRIVGKPYYAPWFGKRPLPKISIVTPVKNGEEWIRDTIDSVLGQNYPDLEYIVVDGGSTDGTLRILHEYRDRIDRILCEDDQGMYDAIGKGFHIATGDVLGYLNADDVYEPGGLLRVGEFFRDRRRANVIYHDDTVTMGGWRFPNVAQPRVDVYKLLDGHTLYQDGVFFGRQAYELVGGINRELKRCGDWDLFVRLARMFGLRRAGGHVSSFRVRPGQLSEDRAAYQAELAKTRTEFLSRFGLPGRIRCRTIRVFNATVNLLRRLGPRRKFFWPIDYCGKPYPPAEAPPAAPGHPICPLTGRAPDRLLFSTRDTRFGDEQIHYVYYDSSVGMAMAYPPMSHERLDALYEKHYSNPPKAFIEPDPAYHSPFRGYRGGNIVARNLSRLPSPWWWFHEVTYHDFAAEDILREVRRLAPPTADPFRFLDVGCFEGDLLDALKAQTRWELFGLESNGRGVEMARGKGHRVWQASAEDAVMVIPEKQKFDVIFLGQTIEHLDNPLVALRRLRMLLSPHGVILLSVPNLDSKQIEFYGPTWAHWHLPYHRTLLSRKALRRMAELADMQVTRLRSRSHPYWTSMSVQLNRLGLAGVVPHSAYFSNEVASHGVRLVGWSRLLWDWRGKGDYLFATLRKV